MLLTFGVAAAKRRSLNYGPQTTPEKCFNTPIEKMHYVGANSWENGAKTGDTLSK